jgi:putative Mg2+ transporter-C (MgtC) family protein
MVYSLVDPLAKLMGEWSYNPMSVGSILFRIALAFLLGGIIGCERSTKHHTAGFRTYILVTLGSDVCMMVNLALADQADNARLAAGVITGVGFLGAGTILVTTRSQVKGLTTAAALWASCAIGIAIGTCYYMIALVAFVVMIITLTIMPHLERAIQVYSKEFDIHVELLTRPDLKKLIDMLRNDGLVINAITYDPAYANTGLSVYTLSIYVSKSKLRRSDVLLKIKNQEYVNFVEVI